MRRFYEAGDQVEALRIATSLRVLVHDTASSTPLLRLAVPEYANLMITDCARRHYTETDLEQPMALFTVAWTTDPVRGVIPVASLEGAPKVPLGTWWSGFALVFPNPRATGNVIFRRKDLVLVLANRDGGAHVDPDGLPDDHQRLITENPASTGQGSVITTKWDMARCFVAQSGAEMVALLNELTN